MMFRRRLSRVLVVFLFCQWLLASPDAGLAAAAPPHVSAETAAMIDVQSGRILYEKNADKKMRIASLTKIMTAIVAIESGNLKDIVLVPDHAVGVEGSSIYLKKEERLTLEDLLYGLMLRSGNDAAVAIAEHVGGSLEGFVYMMNEKAAMIGMTHTHFMNPHGLDNSNQHYSTAEDMVKLSAYALKHPEFQKIVATKVKNIPWQGEEWGRRLQNKNKMLTLYKGADGIKTGYTRLAKRCLASSATRDGRQLAVVTLNAPDDWNDSMSLMNWGFEQFQPVKIANKGDTVDPDVTIDQRDQNLILTSQADFTYPLKEEEVAAISSRVYLFKHHLDRSMIDQHVGYLQIFLGNQRIGQIPLSVQEAKPTLKVESSVSPDKSIWQMIWKIMAGGILDA
ncbi:D-alanyl-D-alanine carboxypeptidase [Brevibacillus humidisoli]|uniref:D-alanyl-D-alanine carboxypeptidase family protein n=1 Tax=Brevibacillus humidisoli TaxID=2895522 RepID=UPI001E63B3D6|nr:D-alanyl-D-alanine carboxypeptidase family protein [Brevibacillus humidisoli]UFJ42837.1 D-alanyl-D-alanine carboxypeptidase [Brevibacillus humidisoli]